MTIEELNERIKATQDKIDSTQQKFDKYYNKLSDELKELVSVSYTDFVKAKSYLSDEDELNLDNARRTYQQLNTLNNTLEKYKASLEKKSDFKSTDKISIIWDFLVKWKEDTIELVKEQGKELEKLSASYPKDKEEYFKTHKRDYYSEIEFKRDYFNSIDNLTKEVYLYRGQVDEKRLEKLLQDEIEHKYNTLINRVKDKCGNIIDVKNLHLGNDGTPNGYIIGDKGTCKVETIIAGGYNIQIAHYRILVHKIK